MSSDAPLCAIDAQISPTVAGGTETHVALQLDALAKHSGERFVVLGRQGEAEQLRPLIGANMDLVEYPCRYAWGPSEQERLSASENDALLKARGVGLVHFPYPQHFATDLPFVYEPWGLPHHHFPELYSQEEAAWIEALFRDGCGRAAMVITATRWVKRDLMAAYGLPSSRIAVLPRVPLPGPQTLDPSTLPDDLPEGFALFPGVTWPTKNHLGLLRAIARLRDVHGVRLDLICTGRTKKPMFPLIKDALKELRLKSQVRFLGPIPRQDLEALFRRASFLVHPSKFEGLGLPLVEAMRFGLPIVASNAACIPEVVGDAALLFDPDDPEAMALALKKALADPRLLEDLRHNGQRRLQSHFPDHQGLATRFVAIYKCAAGRALTSEERGLIEQMTS
jgi:glycosyltransferase involved in cell wall biosynthesis